MMFNTTEKMVEFVCSRTLSPIICVVGITCNILNLLVLTRHQLRSSPYTYLKVLASTDLGFLLLTFFYKMTSFGPGRYSYFWKIYTIKIFYPFVNVFLTSSIWLTTILTVDRFLFVRHPLWAKTRCSRTSAKVKAACILVLALFLNMPRFFTTKVYWDQEKQHYKIGFTPFETSFQNFILRWVHIILVHLIPLVTLNILNIYLVVAVHRARRLRKTLQARNKRESSSHKDQIRLTITLISIAFLFIICMPLSAFLDRPVAKAFFGGKAFITSSLFRILQHISNFLLILNLSLNFFLYCAFNRRFLNVLKWTMRKWCGKIQCRSKKSANIILHVNFKTGKSVLRRSNSI